MEAPEQRTEIKPPSPPFSKKCLSGAQPGRWITAEFNRFKRSQVKVFDKPARFIALFIIYADSRCNTDLGTDYSK